MKDPEGNQLSEKEQKKQNKSWISDIYVALGKDGTNVEEDENRNLIVYVKGDQGISKAEVKKILQKVLEGKKPKRKPKQETKFTVTMEKSDQQKALDKLAQLANDPSLIQLKNNNSKIKVHSSESESSESESSSGDSEDEVMNSGKNVANKLGLKGSVNSVGGKQPHLNPNALINLNLVNQINPAVLATLPGLDLLRAQFPLQTIPRSNLKPTSTDTSIFSGTAYQNQLAASNQQHLLSLLAQQAQNLPNPLMNNPLMSSLGAGQMNPLMASHKQYDTSNNFPLDPDADKKSIIVLNVHYETSGKELEKHFEVIGQISRVTIVKDKVTQQPKGIAYVQFADESSVITSKCLDQTNFYGRPINVIPKLKSLQSEQQQQLVANAQRWMNQKGGSAAALANFNSSYNRKWERKV